MKNIISMKLIPCIIILTYFITAGIGEIKSQKIPESDFWSEDILLKTLIDSLGRDQVVEDVHTRLDKIQFYLSGNLSTIKDDSIPNWINSIRWSVILNDEQLLQKTNTIIKTAETDERGNWQFYFVYVALSGSYHAVSNSDSEDVNVSYLLGKLDNSSPIQRIFYEDRLMEVNKEAFPFIIDFARKEIFPGMQELEGEKLSMEDFEFHDKYYQIVDIIKNILDQETDTQLFNELLTDQDPNAQRFARDVLGLNSD